MGCLFFYMEFFRWMVWNLKQLFGTAMKTSPFNTMTSYPRIKRRKVSVKLWPPRPTSSNIVGRNNVGRCWTGGPNGSNIIQHDIRQYRNLPESLSCARAWAQQCWTWWPSGPIQHESKENVGQCWTECLTGFKHHPTSPIQHGGQTSPTCCAEQCWMAMLGSFGQGLRCSPVLRRLSLKLSHALMASSLDSFDRVYYFAYEHASHSKPRSVFITQLSNRYLYGVSSRTVVVKNSGGCKTVRQGRRGPPGDREISRWAPRISSLMGPICP